MGWTANLRVPAEGIVASQEELDRLPVSARTVFDTIVAEGPMSHSDLRRVTGMPQRTIGFALRRLRDEQMLDSRVSLHDCRTCYFFVHPRLVSQEVIKQGRDAVPSTGIRVETERPPIQESRIL
jgi:DNA-binding transcriptional ArsR family regulator